MCMPSSMEHQQIGTYIMNPYLNKYYVCATVVHSLIKVAVVRWHELVQSLAPLYLNTSSSSSTHVSRGRRMRANSQTLMPTHTLVAWRVTSRRILLHKKITPPGPLLIYFLAPQNFPGLFFILSQPTNQDIRKKTVCGGPADRCEEVISTKSVTLNPK